METSLLPPYRQQTTLSVVVTSYSTFRGPNLYSPSPHCNGGSIPQHHSPLGPPAGYSSHLGPDNFPCICFLFSPSPFSLILLLLLCFSHSLFFYFSPISSPSSPPFSFPALSYRFLVCPSCTIEAPFLRSSPWFSIEILHSRFSISVLLIGSLFQSFNLLPLLDFPCPSVHIIMFLCFAALHVIILPWSSARLGLIPPPFVLYFSVYHHILY